MPRNGHLSWKAVFQPGAVKAVGYKNGKKILARTVETTGAPARISLTADRPVIQADNRDVAVCNIELQDKKKRFVPTACNDLTITVSGPVRILGVGNGDPAYRATERPADADARTYQVKAFNGLAQVLLQSTGEVGEATMTVGKPAGNFLRLEAAEVSDLSFISSGEAETFLLFMGQERDLRFFLPQTIVCKCTRCASHTSLH